MNYSTLLKNAILNLYRNGIYTLDYAIVKAEDYNDKNKFVASDYEEIMTYFADLQVTEEESPEQIISEVEEGENLENQGI